MNDKKSLGIVFLCYLIWGLQPFYWNHMAYMDSYYLLACRIIMGAAFAIALLALSKRLPELWAIFRDKKLLKSLIPAALLLLVDWGLFLIAVQSGRVLDTSLGYYMNPLVIFLFSIVLFKEQCNWLRGIAIGLAVTGVAISAIQYGKFPLISVALALAFAIYAAVKKKLQLDPIVSIAAETIIMSPLAIIFLIFFRSGAMAGGAANFPDLLLLIGAGIITALPMMLYSRGVNKLPMLTMGFMQYISPTLSLLSGLVMGEALTPDKLTSFLFIWTALILFSIAMVRDDRKFAMELKESK